MSGIEGRGPKPPGAKRAVGAPALPLGATAKRPKTGGRRKLSLEEEMARARIASEIAGFHDDTTLNEEQAAIFLGVSVSTLEFWRSKPNDPADPRGFEGPEMIKIIGRGAVGQNQRVNYKLGALRAFQARNTSRSSFDSALRAGLLGWTNIQMPFFAKFEVRDRQTCLVICGNAWNMADPRRESLFFEWVQEKIRLISSTSRDAALSYWDDVGSHQAYAKIGASLRRAEARAEKAAIANADPLTHRPQISIWRGNSNWDRASDF
jgi:hypothetical protein